MPAEHFCTEQDELISLFTDECPTQQEEVKLQT
jgi:hypothetical protein